jgi:hypothetical protein
MQCSWHTHFFVEGRVRKYHATKMEDMRSREVIDLPNADPGIIDGIVFIAWVFTLEVKDSLLNHTSYEHPGCIHHCPPCFTGLYIRA